VHARVATSPSMMHALTRAIVLSDVFPLPC